MRHMSLQSRSRQPSTKQVSRIVQTLQYFSVVGISRVALYWQFWIASNVGTKRPIRIRSYPRLYCLSEITGVSTTVEGIL